MGWFIIAAAYAVAGFYYVTRDTREPVFNRPAYTFTRRGRWIVRTMWLPIGVWTSWRLRRSTMLRFFYTHLSKQLAPCLAMLASGTAIGLDLEMDWDRSLGPTLLGAAILFYVAGGLLIHMFMDAGPQPDIKSVSYNRWRKRADRTSAAYMYWSLGFTVLIVVYLL
jgi:hypothetical protein